MLNMVARVIAFLMLFFLEETPGVRHSRGYF